MNHKQIIILYKGEEFTARLPNTRYGCTATLTGKKNNWHALDLKEDGTATLQGSSKALGQCRWRVEGAPTSDHGYGIVIPNEQSSLIEKAEYGAGIYHRHLALIGR